MPKYYAKEDVENGLVDPKKPLSQQPEYEKQLLQKKQLKTKMKEKNEKNFQYEQKKQNKSNFNWNRNLITLDTEIPILSSKQCQEPNKNKFKEDLNNLKDYKEKLIIQKKQLILEEKNILKNINQTQKTSKLVKNKFWNKKKGQIEIKKSLERELQIFNQRQQYVLQHIKIIKQKINGFGTKDNYDLMSTEQLKQLVDKKQNNLALNVLGKHQQNKVNKQIILIKRALANSKSKVEIDGEVNKYRDQLNILYPELKDIKGEEKKKISEIKVIKSQLFDLKEQQRQQSQKMIQKRSEEQIRNDYDKKIHTIDRQIEEAALKIHKLKSQYNLIQDKYYAQQEQIKYQVFIKNQLQYLKDKAKQEEKIKNQKEERQKERQKQKEEFEKKKEQKRRLEEEKKIKEEQKMIQLEEKNQRKRQQRQKFINKNPNSHEIQLCNFLIKYCEILKPEKQHKITDKEMQDTKIALQGIQWEKQVKHGAEIIISKKTKNLDEQNRKKIKNQKKKEQKKNQTTDNFSHSMEIVNRFQNLNLLPPTNSIEIEPIISQLQQKIAIYNKPTLQQINLYQEKAGLEFDKINGLVRDKKVKFVQKYHQEIEQQPKKKQKRYIKKNNKELNQKEELPLNIEI